MLGYDIVSQLEFLMRISLAGICGAIIGYERKSRLKEAGIRTHFIVALASGLIMIVSKYCFTDVQSYDPSRIASSIVSGVGFLGAGMIFIRRHTINGLTTAAGIWATSGVGMAIGGGFYFLGITTTVIILFGHSILRNNSWLIRKIPEHENIRFVVANKPEIIKIINETFKNNCIDILSVHIENAEGSNYLTMDMDVKTVECFSAMDIASIFSEVEGIKSIDL